ncbi:related to bood POZ containing protein [Cephalotrichum gorgonifer]|uniref:Related to bood POZ containing protein n=1 Tax=Cephalotrichum gorgonifer TaxID=2041049 RepID=A0AAE8STE8_9PEZI|nr:related to bood POZ containing protein [Cephalotrichum gorgonifer]
MVLRKDQLEAKLSHEAQLVKSGALKEENPLDLSPEFNQLVDACRRGDLRTCQELISAGVNFNGRDRFDYTPLIIASLCGHYELVQLLLESGALAERNTFQGERCVYNALNDKIRDLLLQYDFSKSTDPLQAWSAHITSLLSRETPRTSDIALVADSQSFALHRFLLSARSPYFRRKLAVAPGTETFRLPSSLPMESFRIVMQYLYLDEIPRDVVDASSGNTEEDVLKGIDRISRDLEVDSLWESMLAMNDRRLTRQRYQAEVDRAQGQVRSFFEKEVLGNEMVVERGALDGVKWPRTNPSFADCLLAAYEPSASAEGTATPREPGAAGRIPAGPLLDIAQDGASPSPAGTQKVVLYPVHKAMLIRSPYFETMFSSEFKEAQESEHLHVVTLDFTPDVLRLVLSFLYTETADCPLDLALDLLYAADMLFLDKLKGKAATVISTLGSGTAGVNGATGAGTEADAEAEPVNIYDVIHAAWDLRVQRLEEFAARYLAYRLEDYIDDEEFAELIRLSAARITRREETDTIELLDDIRYYLSERFRLRFEDAGLEFMGEDEDEDGVDALAGELEEKASLGGEGREEQGREEGGGGGGVMRTLDGNVVTDEFDSDAINYELWLAKIDAMLEKLKLDA